MADSGAPSAPAVARMERLVGVFEIVAFGGDVAGAASPDGGAVGAGFAVYSSAHRTAPPVFVVLATTAPYLKDLFEYPKSVMNRTCIYTPSPQCLGFKSAGYGLYWLGPLVLTKSLNLRYSR